MTAIHEEKLSVIVETREKLQFRGNAWGITSLNDNGTFDILPGHSNFITLIKEYMVIHANAEDKRLTFTDGVLWITHDTIKVCLAIIPTPTVHIP